MRVIGTMLIGNEDVTGSEPAFRAVDPATGEPLEPAYAGGGQAHVERAARLAEEAFASYRTETPRRRAAFLREIGARIMALGDVLIERAMAESGLPRARLEGERGRTVKQLELFAAAVEAGDWHGVRIDDIDCLRCGRCIDVCEQRVFQFSVVGRGTSGRPASG